jgi:acetolactate synthase I/III small subunit
MQKNLRTLSIIVKNELGVLTRVSSLFSSRGFNIENITVGPMEDPQFSRIIIVIIADDQSTEQIAKQLLKLVQVKSVKDITNIQCIQRELLLIKIFCTDKERAEILEVAKFFGGLVRKIDFINLNKIEIIFEIAGKPEDTNTFLKFLKLNNYTINEIVSTGKISMEY